MDIPNLQKCALRVQTDRFGPFAFRVGLDPGGIGANRLAGTGLRAACRRLFGACTGSPGGGVKLDGAYKDQSVCAVGGALREIWVPV